MNVQGQKTTNPDTMRLLVDAKCPKGVVVLTT